MESAYVLLSSDRRQRGNSYATCIDPLFFGAAADAAVTQYKAILQFLEALVYQTVLRQQ